jgi:PAS domain S-box-containing protein
MTAKRTHPKLSRSPSYRRFLHHSNPLAKILDLTGDPIISVDRRRCIVFYNQGAEKMFGYAPEEVRGKPLELLHPSRLATVRGERIETSDQHGGAGRTGDRWEVRGRRKDGSEFRAMASLSKIEVGGRILFTYVLQEVTPQTAAEERLRAILRDKEVLLEEVHHRVKNNLQVITSLLGLQARSIKNPATREKFEESRYRIQAMAMLHEILYESTSLAEIDFADYIRRLAEYLIRSYGAAGRIRLQARLDSLCCHRDVALPCGLIVNELLSNTFKYAFPERKSGEVFIELRREPGGTVHLLVGDNGVGLPRGFDWENSPTLGLRLVRALARQIEANVETNGSRGTVFSITFLDGLSINTN